MDKSILSTYFIMGSNNVTRPPLEVLEEALIGGITLFQLREKGENALTGEALVEFAKQCQSLCRKYKVPFIVNDDFELAVQLDADGVHVGQSDINATVIRPQFKGKILGVSVHNLEEMQNAIQAGVDYVGIGPVYATSSKSDATAPTGTAMIKLASEHFPSMPIVAIGGLQPEHTAEVIQAGAAGLSIISAIASAKDATEATKRFVYAL